ncbi:MLO-like protein 9 [Pyrus ussuriensis x Pyrus communis]|uniref:MLO-like protein 9 n=1 Tax=Pyrus ussuriensis x Pyrus communis TaxID=2448454 RepID=A0A5N5HJE9_9ROSA|nr:MLO-like protein 9 [Pyrus ussuriensis x Pyrus communis]
MCKSLCNVRRHATNSELDRQQGGIWHKNAAMKKGSVKPAAKPSSGGKSVTRPPPKAKMDKNASAPEHTANIMANIDIQGNNTDLLLGS